MLQLFSTADMQLYSGDHRAWASEERRHALGSCDFHNYETKEKTSQGCPFKPHPIKHLFKQFKNWMLSQTHLLTQSLDLL